MENPIFVIGLPRSGSTLWENIIAESPEVLRLAEMLFLTPWKKDFRYFLRKHVGSLSREQNVARMVDLILSKRGLDGIKASFWRFENIGAIKKHGFREALIEGIIGSERSLGSIFKTLLEKITQFSGYKRCCVAFPVYPNHVPNLIEWYPACRIVHVTRDPRAIAASKTNDPSGTAVLIKRYPHLKWVIRRMMILFVVVQYIWTSRLHAKFKPYDNYMLFHYEDLLVNPEGTIRELCDFIGVEFVASMLEPKEGMPSSITGKRYAGISTRAAMHWKRVLSRFEKLMVTWLTRSSMKRFDFDPETHPIYR